MDTCSYDPYTKHIEENDIRFFLKHYHYPYTKLSNLPPPKNGRIELPPSRVTHIPSKMMNMTIDFVETLSLSLVTYHRQKMVV